MGRQCRQHRLSLLGHVSCGLAAAVRPITVGVYLRFVEGSCPIFADSFLGKFVGKDFFNVTDEIAPLGERQHLAKPGFGSVQVLKLLQPRLLKVWMGSEVEPYAGLVSFSDSCGIEDSSAPHKRIRHVSLLTQDLVQRGGRPASHVNRKVALQTFKNPGPVLFRNDGESGKAELVVGICNGEEVHV